MRRTRALLARCPVGPDGFRARIRGDHFEVKAIVKENFERAPSNEPCVLDEVAATLTCPGQGNAGRFGQLTSSAIYDGSQFVTRTLTFRDGSTLTLLEEYGEPMFPGNSLDAPGAMKSFGNPFSAGRNVEDHRSHRQPGRHDRIWHRHRDGGRQHLPVLVLGDRHGSLRLQTDAPRPRGRGDPSIR